MAEASKASESNAIFTSGFSSSDGAAATAGAGVVGTTGASGSGVLEVSEALSTPKASSVLFALFSSLRAMRSTIQCGVPA